MVHDRQIDGDSYTAHIVEGEDVCDLFDVDHQLAERGAEAPLVVETPVDRQRPGQQAAEAAERAPDNVNHNVLLDGAFAFLLALEGGDENEGIQGKSRQEQRAPCKGTQFKIRVHVAFGGEIRGHASLSSTENTNQAAAECFFSAALATSCNC